MATTMESAFNASGWFATRRPGLIQRARHEMVCHLLAARRRAVAEQIADGERHLTAADLEFAVREMSARVSRKRGTVVLPGMRGWALAGGRKPS